jgi:N-methylhydantoinase A
VHDLTAPLSGPLVAAGGAMAAAVARLSREAAALLAEDGIPEALRESAWSLDGRYAGQAFELNLPLPAGPGDVARAAAEFHALHRQRFSYDEPETPVEVVALRLAARGRLAGAPKAMRAPPPGDGRARGWRALRLDRGTPQAEVWDRHALSPAVPVAGPALVEEPYTTSFLPPGWTATLHASGAIIAVRDRAGAGE